MSKVGKTNQNQHSVKVNSIDSNLDCTYILSGKVKQHFANWEGHLSLKTFSGGQAFYNVGAGNYVVNDDSFLLVNEHQSYTVTIDAEPFVESFIIFFETGFVEDIERNLKESNSQLLDNPTKPLTKKIEFIPRLYSRKFIENPLRELRNTIQSIKDEQLWLKEKLCEIMTGLLAARQETLKEIEQIPAIRAATREEIYKRIYRARDFAEAFFYEPITLDEIAKVACLSPNHLLRCFKQVFHQTPHQYLTALRLREAQKLLTKTNLSVINICQAVGFHSQSSFSLLFRRHLGISPEKYRRQKGDFR